MQRRVAAAERIRIGAVFEQQRRHVAVAAVGREDQGTHTVRLRVVRVCARFQQHPGGLDVADPRGKQQRRGPAAQHRVVQLFASGALRLLVHDGLRVGPRSRTQVGTGLDE